MNQINKEPLLKGMPNIQTSLLNFDLQLGVRFVKKSEDFVEEFGFNSSESDAQHCCFIVNHLAELNALFKWFVSENKQIFSSVDEIALDLASLIGTEFYTDRIQKSDPLYQSKNKLLSELGIKEEPKLSELELETLKLVVKGFTASQIAEKLCRSKRTIEHRLENIKIKFSCCSKQELVEKAFELEQLQFIPL